MLGSDASTYVTFHVGMSDSNGGFEEFGTGIQETAAPPPPPPVAGLAIAVSADALDGALDELGETVVYTSTVTNTGNYALAGVDVTGAAGENGVLVSGDTDGDDLLDLNESWVFTYAGAQALTQNDLDAGGAFSSTATATTTSDSTATDTDTANEPIVQLPEIEAELTATVDGGTADIVGEDVEFTLTVKNTGNVTLDGAALDPVPTGAIRTGDVDNDNLLSVGETWTYSFAHDVTQADLDAGGVIGADIDVAAGSGTRSAEDNDNAASVTAQALAAATDARPSRNEGTPAADAAPLP